MLVWAVGGLAVGWRAGWFSWSRVKVQSSMDILDQRCLILSSSRLKFCLNYDFDQNLQIERGNRWESKAKDDLTR